MIGKLFKSVQSAIFDNRAAIPENEWLELKVRLKREGDTVSISSFCLAERSIPAPETDGDKDGEVSK